MQIINRCNCRILIKDNNKEVDISDGSIIEYDGIYYKNIENTIVNTVDIRTKFIGKVDCHRSDETGTTGIYIIPLYLFNIKNNEWNKISNHEYPIPKQKYFLYPHLLMLPDKYYNYKPLYFLDTCENKSLDNLNNVTELIHLESAF